MTNRQNIGNITNNVWRRDITFLDPSSMSRKLISTLAGVGYILCGTSSSSTYLNRKLRCEIRHDGCEELKWRLDKKTHIRHVEWLTPDEHLMLRLPHLKAEARITCYEELSPFYSILLHILQSYNLKPTLTANL